MKRVGEFAKAKGISRGRVYELVRAGSLPAQILDDGSVLLEDAAMAWRPRKGRPLSEPMAWHLLSVLDGERPAALRDAERARIRRYMAAIAAADHPAEELASKVSARAELREFAAHRDDVADLRADPRVLVSGVGAAGSGMSAGDVVEAYVDPDMVDRVIRDYVLKERRGGNVRLRVGKVRQMGNAVIAADLADWGRVRELREADRLVHDLLQEIA